jgi:CRISPR-associated protein Csd1
MSWIQKLYETYEAAQVTPQAFGEAPLVPVSHSIQQAHILVKIDGEGNFLEAEVRKQYIILPATEKSAGRSGKKPPPHLLADKIQYCAKDYPDFRGGKPSFFVDYEAQLKAWVESEFNHPKAEAILKYIQKGNVLSDLIKEGIIWVDENSHLRTSTWKEEAGGGEENEKTPEIFKVLTKKDGKYEIGDALIAWRVEIAGDLCANTWEDIGLFKAWSGCDAASKKTYGRCYLTGKDGTAIAEQHPAKIRHTGDKAKLISSNDGAGFTFRGRFTDKPDRQACAVGYVSTQKVHNALRWLISRQAYQNYGQVFVAWAVSGKEIPATLASSSDLFDFDLDIEDLSSQSAKSNGPEPVPDNTKNFAQRFSLGLKNYLQGYRTKLSPTEDIVIMGLDAATPGRMAILFCREMMAGDFLDRIYRWHSNFAWWQRKTMAVEEKGKKSKVEVTWRIFAPAPRLIAEAAYGKRLDDSLKKTTVQRIVPCIIDGQTFPRDLMQSAVNRASNRVGMENWEWQQTLGVACALYRGFYAHHSQTAQRREYQMTLETDRISRDYLYGRLLAIAERIEEIALNVAGEKRPTTAERMMQRFADYPFSTWKTIETALRPYMDRLQSKRAGFLHNMRTLLDEVMNLFVAEEFCQDNKLSGEFLLGYHCQRQILRNNKSSEQADQEGE